MAQILNIGRNVTRKYNAGHGDCDEWQHVGQVKLLPARQIEPGHNYDEGGTYLYRAILARGVDPEAGAKALQDTLTERGASRCWHEHDCCGCQHTRVDVTKARGGQREFIVRASVGYNY